MLGCLFLKQKEKKGIMRNKEFYILFVLCNLFSLSIKAQCAMCKASVETNLDAGGTKGSRRHGRHHATGGQRVQSPARDHGGRALRWCRRDQ